MLIGFTPQRQTTGNYSHSVAQILCKCYCSGSVTVSCMFLCPGKIRWWSEESRLWAHWDDTRVPQVWSLHPLGAVSCPQAGRSHSTTTSSNPRQSPIAEVIETITDSGHYCYRCSLLKIVYSTVNDIMCSYDYSNGHSVYGAASSQQVTSRLIHRTETVPQLYVLRSYICCFKTVLFQCHCCILPH